MPCWSAADGEVETILAQRLAYSMPKFYPRALWAWVDPASNVEGDEHRDESDNRPDVGHGARREQNSTAVCRHVGIERGLEVIGLAVVAGLDRLRQFSLPIRDLQGEHAADEEENPGVAESPRGTAQVLIDSDAQRVQELVKRLIGSPSDASLMMLVK